MAECNSIMVVYAYSKDGSSLPWIYGLYSNHLEGLEIQEQMQESKEYGHLIWSNSVGCIE